MIHETRVIPLDGRPHVAAIRSCMGDSRGHWEGNTLVVDTTNFNGKPGAANGNLLMTSDALELIERFTRTGPDTIHYEVDASTIPRRGRGPWRAAYPLRRDPGYKIFEYACHEGNHAMREHPVRRARRRGRRRGRTLTITNHRDDNVERRERRVRRDN